jgi:hypothetical protein
VRSRVDGPRAPPDPFEVSSEEGAPHRAEAERMIAETLFKSTASGSRRKRERDRQSDLPSDHSLTCSRISGHSRCVYSTLHLCSCAHRFLQLLVAVHLFNQKVAALERGQAEGEGRMQDEGAAI